MPQSRQLAAIMFTDIVGYTALMERDEKRAFEVLKKNLAIHQSVIKEFKGRLIKELGDGILATFSTVSDALNASINIQQRCEELNEFDLSIGIHQGEVVFKDGDVFGDAVNVASRIQSLGIPGSILFSKKIADEVKNKAEFQTTSLGGFEFKNVAESIEVFALSNDGFPVPRKNMMQGKLKMNYNKRNGIILTSIILLIVSGVFIYREFFSKNYKTDTVGKSIAVLPFTDMSPGKDQEYFSDGLSEELINSLAKIPTLKVAGRTSSFSYKGVNKNLKAIGEELGVSTILEGSLRKSGNQLRITAQLINSNDGFHLWTETFDIELTDVFAVQDKITAAIISALNVHLLNDAQLEPTTTTNPEAYTTYLKARQKLSLRGYDLLEARRLFEDVIRLDPEFAPAYSGLGRTLSISPIYVDESDVDDLIKSAKKAAGKALELNPNSAEAYSVLGSIAAYYDWDWVVAERDFLKSVALSPNDAEMYNFLGDYYLIVQNEKLAIEMESKALELDPLSLTNHSNLSWAYLTFKDYENALRITNVQSSLVIDPFNNLQRIKVMSYVGLGLLARAQAIVDSLAEEDHRYLEMKTIVAIAKGETDLAKEYIAGLEGIMLKAQFYLNLGMWTEAAFWIEKAYENRDSGLVYFSTLTVPEDYGNTPELTKAFDKPELNKLFELRRKNLKQK